MKKKRTNENLEELPPELMVPQPDTTAFGKESRVIRTVDNMILFDNITI